MDQLIREIKSKCPPSYRAQRDDNGKLTPTVANLGLKAGQLASRGDTGEYAGLTVVAIDPVLPLLTDDRIIRALEYIRDDQLFEASHILQVPLSKDFSTMRAVLVEWLRVTGIDCPAELRSTAMLDANLKRWIRTTSSDFINGRLRIAETGASKEAGGSVVPENWIGREFPNAKAIHDAMDSLPWRQNRPPVQYCVCYFMKLVQAREWMTQNTVDIHGATMGAKIEFRNGSLHSDVEEFKSESAARKWVKDKSHARLQFTTFSCQIGERMETVLFACRDVFQTPEYRDTENVGVLSSRLQKCNRRGRSCAGLLARTMVELNSARPYNIPQMQFLRSSGTRQLLWRLFISTIEDTVPFSDGVGYAGMLDIAIMALMCHADYRLQLRKEVLEHVIQAALGNQRRDTPEFVQNWRSMPPDTNNLAIEHKTANHRLTNAFKLALRTIQCMSGDKVMLHRGIWELQSETTVITPLPKISRSELLRGSVQSVEHLTELNSYDMISVPSILLLMQASWPQVPSATETTRELSSSIWNISSGRNVRLGSLTPSPREMPIYNMLVEIERYIQNPSRSKTSQKVPTFKPGESDSKSGSALTELERRTAFIIIWGREEKFQYNGQTYTIAVCGEPGSPCRVKPVMNAERSDFLSGALRDNIERAWMQSRSARVDTVLPDPPEGTDWTIPRRTTVEIRHGTWMVDKYVLPEFDARPILRRIPKPSQVDLDGQLLDCVLCALYAPKSNCNRGFEFLHYMRQVTTSRLKSRDYRIFKWYTRAGNIPTDVWRLLLLKIKISETDRVECGPVDGMGNKVQFAVNYQFEGTLVRLLTLMSMLYPRAFSLTDNLLVFRVDRRTVEYCDFESQTAFLTRIVDRELPSMTTNPKITTAMWPHQKRSVERILTGIREYGRLGFGDSSDMGSGKTLKSLGVIAALMQTKPSHYYAALVLLPTANLFASWQNEIANRTSGFHVVTQAADGRLSGEVIRNSIVLTTMGRNREHPLDIPWVFVVIDECLTVSNQSALWSLAAYKSVTQSLYGVLLLSGTFFRSRFNQLYYMLRMLRTGLPCSHEYLTSILSECIICDLPIKTFKWTQHVVHLKLPAALRSRYDALQRTTMSSERLFQVLQKFIYDNFDYTAEFLKQLKILDRRRRRVLIFANNIRDAERIARENPDVGLYPDRARHVVGTIATCGYGVNDLVEYDTILLRIPNPQTLPQLKARLARPGQKNTTLEIVFLNLAGTVEMADLMLLDLATKFRRDYILPLAEYYDVATGRKPIAS